MQEKPKPEGAEDPDAWAEDQKDREYYYDDAHGYEEYEPGAEEEPEEDTETPRLGEGGGAK